MDFWTQYGGALAQLGFTAAGIAAYTIVVTWLYVPMGHRLMFAKRMGEDQVSTTGRRFLYVLLFPLVSFAFFLVVAGAMLFLTSYTPSVNQTPEEHLVFVLTLSMATVLAIRVCAYVHETAADELAKVMPLGLIGVVLVTNGIGSFPQIAQKMEDLAGKWQLIVVFFVVVVAVEFLLRLIYELAGRPGRKPPHKAATTARPTGPTFQRTR